MKLPFVNSFSTPFKLFVVFIEKVFEEMFSNTEKLVRLNTSHVKLMRSFVRNVFSMFSLSKYLENLFRMLDEYGAIKNSREFWAK